jgi:hypothetical protein
VDLENVDVGVRLSWVSEFRFDSLSPHAPLPSPILNGAAFNTRSSALGLVLSMTFFFAVYLINIVSDKMNIGKVLFSLSYRIWI